MLTFLLSRHFICIQCLEGCRKQFTAPASRVFYILSGPWETSVLVSQPAVFPVVTLETEWSPPGFGADDVCAPPRQRSLLWVPTLCLHPLLCWQATCPCLQVTYHLVPPQGKSLGSSSTWSQQKKGIWWRQTALMMRSPLPKVCWWRLRNESRLPKSILVRPLRLTVSCSHHLNQVCLRASVSLASLPPGTELWGWLKSFI